VHIIASKTLTSGCTALVASSATPGGGRRYGQFCLIRVVTLPKGMGSPPGRRNPSRGHV